MMNRFNFNPFERTGDQRGNANPVWINRILVPIDFSPCTAETLKYARAFADKFDLVIHLLHVIRLNIAGEEAGIPRISLIREMSDNARRELLKLIEVLWMGDYVATVTVREGRADQVIVKEAQSTKADIIIMGSHGPGRRFSFWPRGTAVRVLQKAPCPVLVVRPGSVALPRTIATKPPQFPAFSFAVEKGPR